MKETKIYGTIEMILGILMLILGLFTLFNMGKPLSTFVYVFGVMSILLGIAEIITFIVVVAKSDWSPSGSLILGILNILMGILLLTNVWAGMVSLTFLVPFWMIFICVSRLFELNSIRKYAGVGTYWYSLIINVLGMVIGFIMLFFPGSHVYAMGLLAGIYLVLEAIEMLVYAYKCLQYYDDTTLEI